MAPQWIDLVDPDEAQLRERAPTRLHARALDRLLEPAQHADEPRPTLESHGDYVFGVFLVPVVAPGEAGIYYQEVDLVLTRELVLTVRKTPPGAEPFDTKNVHETCERGNVNEPGMVAYHLVDEVAEAPARPAPHPPHTRTHARRASRSRGRPGRARGARALPA